MGQMTVGIMLGIEVPEGLRLRGDTRDESTEEDGILENWEEECELRMRALAAKIGCESWEVGHRFIPREETVGDRTLLGFWVAVGAEGERGVPRLGGAMPLDPMVVRERYAKSHKRAVRRWQRFAKWLRGRFVSLPAARLWIAETEVA